MEIKDIYNIEFYCDDLDKTVTIRQYLKTLLKTLWEEGEGFSGKRPFGNSGWEMTLIVPLVENEIVEGEIYYWKDDFDNHYEDIEDYDKQEYYKVVNKLIEEL